MYILLVCCENFYIIVCKFVVNYVFVAIASHENIYMVSYRCFMKLGLYNYLNIKFYSKIVWR